MEEGTAMKVLRIVRNVVLLVLAVCFCAVMALCVLGWQMYTQALEAMPLDQKIRQVQSQESYTTFEELPDTYVEAVIAAEDHRFYQHPGVDVIAIGRALVNDIKAMSYVEGGSTITQQLAKNQYFTQEQTVERKIAEVFMALTMEQHFSKRTILELYVNSIYFGDGYEGIGSASWGYFGKAPSALDADECTLLAGRYLALPVAYDHEPVADGAGRANNMDRETLTACARAFCERLEQGGYETMIYGNSGDMARYDRADLGGRPVWFAEYDAAEPHAQFDFAIWQYTNGGSVAGIGTAVDLNLLLPPAK